MILKDYHMKNSWRFSGTAMIFYHDEEQKKTAEDTMKHRAASIKNRIRTQILPFTGFYLAEDYHQKHSLRGYPELLDEFRLTYPSVEDLVSSTTVSRVNGYLGGSGTCDQLQSEIDDFGLSARGTKILIKAVCGGKSTGRSCTTKNCLP
jgi:peptide-methionine (S)-S-oxide reductase